GGNNGRAPRCRQFQCVSNILFIFFARREIRRKRRLPIKAARSFASHLIGQELRFGDYRERRFPRIPTRCPLGAKACYSKGNTVKFSSPASQYVTSSFVAMAPSTAPGGAPGPWQLIPSVPSAPSEYWTRKAAFPLAAFGPMRSFRTGS